MEAEHATSPTPVGDGVATPCGTSAFVCPCDGVQYDCQKRAPMRAACACKRLLCRKCAGVAATLPDPGPCGLCGAEAVGPFDAGDFKLDRGLLATLIERLPPPPERYVQAQRGWGPPGCFRPVRPVLGDARWQFLRCLLAVGSARIPFCAAARPL
jgi:hypothetical protein